MYDLQDMAPEQLQILDRSQCGRSFTMCKSEGDDPKPTDLTIPSRWILPPSTHEEAVREIDTLAQILVKGTGALCGLYLRICDTIRLRQFTNDEIRAVLGKHMPEPRVSEFIRIANAPETVYRRYQAGLIGFRAVLAECRGYQINSTEFLKQKKIRRTAARLLDLLGEGIKEITVKGRKITVC